MTRLQQTGCALTMLVACVQATSAADTPPAAQWVPQNAVLVLEVSKPNDILDLMLGDKMIKLVTAQPAFQMVESRPDFQGFRQIVQFIETRLGTNWKDASRKLLGGGVTLAVLPDNGAIIIVDSQDENLLKSLDEILIAGAKDDAAKKGNSDAVKSRDYNGVTAWTFDGKSAHALLGKRLIFGSTGDSLKAILDQKDRPSSSSLTGWPRYQQAKQAAGNRTATLFADLATLKQIPDVDKALQASTNPMGALLMAGLTDAAKAGNWLVLGLNVKGETLSLEALTDGKPAETSRFMTPGPDEGAMPNIQVPRQIAGLSFYRDLHAFYGEKDQLFPERTSGLIFFENMMGIFFSGRELTQEIFGEMDPEVRFVVATQQFDPKIGTPRVQLPGFALVLRMKHPEEFMALNEEAWQKFVGLTNITRGQHAEPGLIIDRVTHNDVRFSVAGNSLGKNEDRANLPSRFNYRPALARVGQYLIYSSTEGLTNDLIDALKPTADAAPKVVPGTNTLLDVDGVAFAKILNDNRDQLISQNMTEKGHTQAQAEGEINFLMTLVKHLGHAALTAGNNPDGPTRVKLEVKLNLP